MPEAARLDPATPVLVIDDDDQLLLTLRDLLSLEGYAPFTARGGNEGIELASRMDEPPPVALVDLRLPDMDGLEVVSRLHHISAHTQVVVLTGNASLDSAVRALRENSVDYLIKPVEPQTLIRTIDRAAERWKREAAEEALERERMRLREILEMSPVGITIVGTDGRIHFLNRSAAEILGMPREDALGLSPREGEIPLRPRSHEDASERGARVLDMVLEEGTAVRDVEYEYEHPDGRTHLLSVNGAPLRGRDGEIESILAVFTDLTERRQLEEELRHAQKMDAVGRLAGGVAHDFNNILTVILARTDLILGEMPETDPLQEELRVIRDAAAQAAGVTRQLLAFGRRQPTRPERIDLNRMVEEIETLLDRVIGANIRVEDELDPKLPPVEADAGQIQQVLMNLAINARDAMPNGGVLTFRTRVREAEGAPGERLDDGGSGPWVTVEVQDTGHGMDEATRKRIFEPFFTTKEEGKGTGLGLATVYGIVSQAAGRIEVESETGQGTSFRIWLPATRGEIPEEEVEERDGREGRKKVADPTEATILVVDDEDSIRSVIRRALVRDGFTVLEASHGREALDIVEGHEGRIDLLLVDLDMPGVPSAQFVPRIQERNPGIAIAIVSGMNPEEAGLARLESATFIPKPFTLDGLRGTVRKLLGLDPPPSAEGPGEG